MLDLVHGWWRGHGIERPAPGEVAGAPSWHHVPHYDVTAFASDIDLDPLDAIQSAPAWMTRAERLMLYTLTFCLRPRRYLEIGTYQGGSALVVHSALTSLGSDARLFCVDPQPAVAAEHWQLLAKRTTLIEGYSPQILPQVMRLAGGRFDLVLIDGDHTYRGVLADANGALACAEHGGYILFHDGFHVDVKRAIDEFVEAHREQVIDLGMLTREVTSQLDDAGNRVEWGGLRLVYVA
ncbi:MAG: class I SAM-dependent methyltransferase [Anaerolineae bacterium]|nr:class I SAM-dependent methyltransferase [Anaerolineae bacterium]